MKNDFGSTMNEILKATIQCYQCWPEIDCKFCYHSLYAPDGKELIVRACCGIRLHVSCYLEQQKQLPNSLLPCIAEGCNQRDQKEEEHQLFLLDFNRRPYALFGFPPNIPNDIQFMCGEIEKRLQFLSSCPERSAVSWEPWPYLTDGTYLKEGKDAKVLPPEIQLGIEDKKRTRETKSSMTPSKKKQKTSSTSPFHMNQGQEEKVLTDLRASTELNAGKKQPRLEVNFTPVALVDDDVGYISGQPKSGLICDITFGSLFFRVDISDFPEITVDGLTSLFGKVFLPSYSSPELSCLKCKAKFKYQSSLDSHMATAKLFNSCQSLNVSQRNYFGLCAFYVPSFVLKFVKKLSEEIIAPIFRIDSTATVTALPAISQHDPSAKSRAKREREIFRKFVSNNDLKISHFLDEIVQSFKHSIGYRPEKNAALALSPMFAYIPYVLPLWSQKMILGIDAVTHQRIQDMGSILKSHVQDCEPSMKEQPDKFEFKSPGRSEKKSSSRKNPAGTGKVNLLCSIWEPD